MIRSPRFLAYAALTLCSALWGSNSVVSRALLDSITSTELVMLRWLLVIAMLAPFAWRERGAIVETLREHHRAMLLLALLGFAPQHILVFSGLARTTAIKFGVLTSAGPVMIVLIAALVHKRRPQPLEAFGLAVSLAGVLLVAAHGDLRALARFQLNGGDLVVLLAQVVWGLYMVRLAQRPGTMSFTAYLFVGGVLGLMLVLPAIAWQLAAHGLPSLTLPQWSMIVYVAALPTIAAMLLLGYAIARVGAVQAGIFSHLVPIFTAMFAMLALGERLSPHHAVAFALIAGGALLCCLHPEPMLAPRVAARAP